MNDLISNIRADAWKNGRTINHAVKFNIKCFNIKDVRAKTQDLSHTDPIWF